MRQEIHIGAHGRLQRANRVCVGDETREPRTCVACSNVQSAFASLRRDHEIEWRKECLMLVTRGDVEADDVVEAGGAANAPAALTNPHGVARSR